MIDYYAYVVVPVLANIVDTVWPDEFTDKELRGYLWNSHLPGRCINQTESYNDSFWSDWLAQNHSSLPSRLNYVPHQRWEALPGPKES